MTASSLCACEAQMVPHDPLPNVCPERVRYNPDAPLHQWDESGAMSLDRLKQLVEELRRG